MEEVVLNYLLSSQARANMGVMAITIHIDYEFTVQYRNVALSHRLPERLFFSCTFVLVLDIESIIGDRDDCIDMSWQQPYHLMLNI